MSDINRSIERTRDALLEDGVILCVRLDKGETALEDCLAAVRGGLRVFEITLTTPGALDLIARLRDDEGLLIGAGTVLTTANVESVAEAGGRFVLSPVFDAEVVDRAHREGMLAIPGASTPKEILEAHRHGSRLVKVFPAGALGGPAYLRAIRGPLRHVDLVPTNGPTADTIADYVGAGAVAVGVGGEVFPAAYTRAHIEAASSRVRKAMDRARRG